jgi:hypothetical protein
VRPRMARQEPLKHLQQPVSINRFQELALGLCMGRGVDEAGGISRPDHFVSLEGKDGGEAASTTCYHP